MPSVSTVTEVRPEHFLSYLLGIELTISETGGPEVAAGGGVLGCTSIIPEPTVAAEQIHSRE